MVAFVIASGGGDDDDNGSTRRSRRDGGRPTANERRRPPTTGRPSRPSRIPVVTVKDAKPVGGIQKIKFTKGDTIRFKVVSDTADEIHFHGYDVAQGRQGRAAASTLRVPATIEGRFVVELEDHEHADRRSRGRPVVTPRRRRAPDRGARGGPGARAARATRPRTAWSASRTCRSRAGCSRGRRRSCSSRRSSAWRCCGPTPRLQDVAERRRFDVPRALEVLFGALGVAFFVFCVYAGFAGTQAATANILPTIIYVFFWVGIPFVSVLFGDVFRAVNPWLAIGKAPAGSSGARGAAGGRRRAAGLPGVAGPLAGGARRPGLRVGRAGLRQQGRPVAAGDDGARLRGGAAGRDERSTASSRGRTRGDAFGVYFGMFARISPLHWRDRGLSRAPVLGGAPKLTAVAGHGRAAVHHDRHDVASTASRRARRGTRSCPHLQDFFGSLGLNAEHALEMGGHGRHRRHVLLHRGALPARRDGHAHGRRQARPRASCRARSSTR